MRVRGGVKAPAGSVASPPGQGRRPCCAPTAGRARVPGNRGQVASLAGERGTWWLPPCSPPDSGSAPIHVHPLRRRPAAEGAVPSPHLAAPFPFSSDSKFHVLAPRLESHCGAPRWQGPVSQCVREALCTVGSHLSSRSPLPRSVQLRLFLVQDQVTVTSDLPRAHRGCSLDCVS